LSSTTSGQSINFVLTITTYANLAITSSTTSEGYVGGTYSFTVTTSPASTITASGAVLTGRGVTWSTPTLSGTFNSTAAPTTSPFYTDYSITYSASATIGGLPATATQTHTLRVYAALSFTSLPSISNVQSAIMGNMANLLATIEGAMFLSVDWGDGTIIAYDTTEETTDLDVSYEYASPGKYAAKIIAENDNGTVQSIVLLDIGSGGGEEEGDDATAIAGWGLLVILFLGLIVAGFLAARGRPLIGAVVAVLCVTGYLILSHLGV
jgi:hypothetical protein